MRQVILKLALLIAACALLGACQTNRATSIGGACAAFDAPAAVIRGRARQDQRWIDRTVEAGVSACGWSRPKAGG